MIPRCFIIFNDMCCGVLLQGLPVVNAPGEAEATCAALCNSGAVDAVATFDADCLLHGAEEQYKVLNLSATIQEGNKAAKCSLSKLRELLGLASGGVRSLQLIAALAGCDYDDAGAEGLGSKGGLVLVRHLLEGKQVRSGLPAYSIKQKLGAEAI